MPNTELTSYELEKHYEGRYELYLSNTTKISKEVNVWDNKTETRTTIPMSSLGKEDQRTLRQGNKLYKEVIDAKQ